MSSVPAPICLPGSSLTSGNGKEKDGAFCPCFVTERNLSVAWQSAFLASARPGVKAFAPLVVTVTGFNNGEPDEVLGARSLIDAALAAYAKEEDRKKGSNKETDPSHLPDCCKHNFPSFALGSRCGSPLFLLSIFRNVVALETSRKPSGALF